nr:cysteine-rich receptor-like protein kinase 10 [Aegilops tauschii subsp. strangulata]
MRRDTGNYNELADSNTDFPIFNFRVIAAATNNFTESNILGKGGFGNVYKGRLEDGREIAVKRLRVGSLQGAVEFKNEIALISRLQHRNLVKLLGCIGSAHLLQNLYFWSNITDKMIYLILSLTDGTRKLLLNWSTRFKIIRGVARGLLYLHQDSRLMMIHRDLKASNILLNAEMSPKISDFGTARLFGVHEQEGHTNQVVGTFGYMSPEYAMEGIISVKSDVYSFGVLLLEIVSGMKIGTTTPSAHARAHNLIDYAWSLRKDGKMMDLVDSSIVEGCSLVEPLRCIHIGLLSVQDDPDARPLMSLVIASLDNKDIELPQPKEPMCFARRNYGAGESQADDLSLENLKGR